MNNYIENPVREEDSALFEGWVLRATEKVGFTARKFSDAIDAITLIDEIYHLPSGAGDDRAAIKSLNIILNAIGLKSRLYGTIVELHSDDKQHQFLGVQDNFFPLCEVPGHVQATKLKNIICTLALRSAEIYLSETTKFYKLHGCHVVPQSKAKRNRVEGRDYDDYFGLQQNRLTTSHTQWRYNFASLLLCQVLHKGRHDYCDNVCVTVVNRHVHYTMLILAITMSKAQLYSEQTKRTLQHLCGTTCFRAHISNIWLKEHDYAMSYNQLVTSPLIFAHRYYYKPQQDLLADRSDIEIRDSYSSFLRHSLHIKWAKETVVLYQWFMVYVYIVSLLLALSGLVLFSSFWGKREADKILSSVASTLVVFLTTSSLGASVIKYYYPNWSYEQILRVTYEPTTFSELRSLAMSTRYTEDYLHYKVRTCIGTNGRYSCSFGDKVGPITVNRPIDVLVWLKSIARVDSQITVHNALLNDDLQTPVIIVETYSDYYYLTENPNDDQFESWHCTTRLKCGIRNVISRPPNLNSECETILLKERLIPTMIGSYDTTRRFATDRLTTDDVDVILPYLVSRPRMISLTLKETNSYSKYHAQVLTAVERIRDLISKVFPDLYRNSVQSGPDISVYEQECYLFERLRELIKPLRNLSRIIEKCLTDLTISSINIKISDLDQDMVLLSMLLKMLPVIITNDSGNLLVDANALRKLPSTNYANLIDIGITLRKLTTLIIKNEDVFLKIDIKERWLYTTIKRRKHKKMKDNSAEQLFTVLPPCFDKEKSHDETVTLDSQFLNFSSQYTANFEENIDLTSATDNPTQTKIETVEQDSLSRQTKIGHFLHNRLDHIEVRIDDLLNCFCGFQRLELSPTVISVLDNNFRATRLFLGISKKKFYYDATDKDASMFRKKNLKKERQQKKKNVVTIVFLNSNEISYNTDLGMLTGINPDLLQKEYYRAHDVI
jgi:hypothetical protein